MSKLTAGAPREWIVYMSAIFYFYCFLDSFRTQHGCGHIVCDPLFVSDFR